MAESPLRTTDVAQKMATAPGGGATPVQAAPKPAAKPGAFQGPIPAGALQQTGHPAQQMTMLTPSPQVQPQAPQGPVTDPNALAATITPENTLRNQRIGFGVGANAVGQYGGGYENVQARDTSGSIGTAFQAQLPRLNLDFERNVEQLAARTAAMGRTGSGLFNRDTGYIGDDARAARESLLGNLVFQSTQNDAQRALQASMSNQGAGLQIAGLNSQRALADANRAFQADMARQSHLQYLQQREDALAQQANQDYAQQMAMAQQGFNYAPTGSVGQAAQVGMQGAGMYGANAAQSNQQLQGAVSQGIQALSGPSVYPQQSYSPGPQVPGWALPQMAPIAPPSPAVFNPKPNRPDIRAEDIGIAY